MLKNIAIVLICLLILFFSVQDFGYMFISLPIFVLMSYKVSVLIIKLNDKKAIRKRAKNFEWILFASLIIFLIFGRYFENTIGGYRLFWKSAVFGLLLNVLTVYVISFFHNFNHNIPTRYNILSLSMSFVLLIPTLSIFINYRFPISADKKERIEINKKHINNGSKGRKSYEIFIKTKFDNNERIDIDQEFYERISNNQLIELTLAKGILGYDYVDDIKAINKY